MANPSYRGRFAPSPTGPLHFGSLVAAVGSWLDARAHGGEWIVRVEDIDTPRCIAGAGQQILRTLENYGLEWDGEVVWQSHRHDLYQAAIERLGAKAFPCGCTRKELSGERYPGTCRNGLAPGRQGRTIRLRVTDEPIPFTDRRMGAQTEILTETCGDFILRRGDGCYAYQLAVVVDDADQQITDIVRGADLLDSTARQIWLQGQLDVPTPRYLHLPVVVNEFGNKLSKQSKAPAIPIEGDEQVLSEALRFLGIETPSLLRGAGCQPLLTWAVSAWPL